MKLKPYPTLWLVTAILAGVALFVIAPAFLRTGPPQQGRGK